MKTSQFFHNDDGIIPIKFFTNKDLANNIISYLFISNYFTMASRVKSHKPSNKTAKNRL